MATTPFGMVASQEVTKKRESLRRISLQLWDRPELAYQEREAHALLCKLLEDEGFKVTRHYLLETGFRAEFVCPTIESAPKPIPPDSCTDTTVSKGQKDDKPGLVQVPQKKTAEPAPKEDANKRPMPLKDSKSDEGALKAGSVNRRRGLGIIKSSDVKGLASARCSKGRVAIPKKDLIFEDGTALKGSTANSKRVQPGAGHRIPKVAFLCEYDALPEIGHACGHNLIAESALAMALVAKQVILEAPAGTFAGSIVVLGTPAEEGGGGKIRMLEAFDDIDAAFIIHPSGLGLNVLNGTTLCSSRLQVNFRSDVHTVFQQETSHVSSDLNLRSMGHTRAMDAAAMAYSHLSMLRRTLPEGWRLCVLLRPLAPYTEVQLEISYRSEKGRDMMPLRDRIVHTLKCAADSMKCQMDFKFTPDYLDQWPNRVLSKRILQYCNVFDKTKDNQPDFKIRGSSDVGNISQIVPTIQVFPSIDEKSSPHEKKFAEVARTEAAESVILEVAVACARTALDYLGDSKMRDAAWAELKARQKLEAESSSKIP